MGGSGGLGDVGVVGLGGMGGMALLTALVMTRTIVEIVTPIAVRMDATVIPYSLNKVRSHTPSKVSAYSIIFTVSSICKI